MSFQYDKKIRLLLYFMDFFLILFRYVIDIIEFIKSM
jgi:hypothetical protein